MTHPYYHFFSFLKSLVVVQYSRYVSSPVVNVNIAH